MTDAPDAHIEFDGNGAHVVGVPTLEAWSAAFAQALSLGASAVWARTDLLGFADEERPYGDDFYQAVSANRISSGTARNDMRRFRRFPPNHPCRRFIHEISVSHYDAVAPLSDDDAEIVLTTAARDPEFGRDDARAEVKRIMNTPESLKATATLSVDANGNARLLEMPPTWAWGRDFEIVLKEKAA